MRKNFLSLFVFLLITCFHTANAQELSLSQTKEILQNHVWQLRRYERDEKKYTVVEKDRGMLLMFDKSGNMYNYRPSSPESPIEPRPFKLTKTHLFYGNNVEDPRYQYELDNLLGYTLSMTAEDEAEPLTYIWEAKDPADVQKLKPRAVVIGADRESYESTPAGALSLIKTIEGKLKEAVGNIKIYNKTKGKGIIDDVSFTATEKGVKMVFEITMPSREQTTYSYEFMPGDIKEMYENTIPEESPVGEFSIRFNNPTSNIVISTKKKITSDRYDDFANVNFLKVDAGNYKKIEGYLYKLRNLYYDKKIERLELLTDLMMRNGHDDLWISRKGSSNTYVLYDVFATGRSLWLQYSLQTISTSGDKKGDYITEIPLRDIKDISLDKNKSRPNSIMLYAGKGGFKTYKLAKDTRYELSTEVDEIPLFIDVTKPAALTRTLELITTHIKECGGKKLSL